MTYYTYSASSSTANVEFCACNMTSCPHWGQWQTYQVNYVSEPSPTGEELPPPRPRPWVVEQVPVVPRAKRLNLAPWRPRQQRARDGI